MLSSCVQCTVIIYFYSISFNTTINSSTKKVNWLIKVDWFVEFALFFSESMNGSEIDSLIASFIEKPAFQITE